jgi:CBS domain-containing protein
MTMQAAAIMRTDYVSLRPEDSALHAARLMVEHHYYALPVMGAGQRLDCVLDITDLIALVLPAYLDEMEDLGFLPGSFELAAQDLPDLRTLTVGQLCATRTERQETDRCALGGHREVRADESILEVARLFVRAGVGKCPVVRDGQVIGMIDPQDLLAVIIARAEEPPA